ncbi:MAG: hypothetical protein ACXWW5_07140 [Actinomycetota bacterium]
MRSKVRLSLLIALVAFSATCSSGDASETAGSGPTTGPASAEVPSGAPTEGPSVAIGTGELPEGFPTSFPLPEGAAAVGSASQGGTFVVWFSSVGDVDDLTSFFDGALAADGWTIEAQIDYSQQGITYKAYTVSGNGYEGQVLVGEGAPGAVGFEGEFAFWVSLTPS